jgi:hypothetical protein
MVSLGELVVVLSGVIRFVVDFDYEIFYSVRGRAIWFGETYLAV